MRFWISMTKCFSGFWQLKKKTAFSPDVMDSVVVGFLEKMKQGFAGRAGVPGFIRTVMPLPSGRAMSKVSGGRRKRE